MTTDQLRKVQASWAEEGACPDCGYKASFSQIWQDIIYDVHKTEKQEPDGSFKVPCTNPNIPKGQRDSHTNIKLTKFK